MVPVNNPIGKSRSIHIVEYSIFGYPSPGEAISAAEAIHRQRMQEMNLNLDDVIGKRVLNFHWDDQNLALEFENGLFLELMSKNKLLHAHLTDKINISTDRDTTFEEHYPSGSTSVWAPHEIADNYIGKVFTNIQIGRQDAWLYFKNMPLLIFCLLMKIKESDKLFLSWDESP